MRLNQIRCVGYGASIAVLLAFAAAQSSATAATVVALGASQTFGKGVPRDESFPAQLEALLRSRGYQVNVVNAGINGDTTGGMLARLDRAVPPDTRVVILQPGINDFLHGVGRARGANISAIEQRLRARGIKVVMMENGTFRGLPHQPDRMHLTPEGYHLLAEKMFPRVASGLR